MGRPSLLQILIIVLIIVLIFGARRLPDVASSIGKSLKIFKKEVTELRDDDESTPREGSTGGGSESASSTGGGSTDPNPAPQTDTAPPNPQPPGDDPASGPGTGSR